ncbi:MAG: MarR family winged helix-turn-helix transcriptional regulator [Candidatus Dormibacteria bacterium]
MSVIAPPTIARETLRQEVLAQMERLMAQHWRQSPAQRFTRHDLSIAQMHLLLVLQERGQATVGQLAETLAISAPSVSAALDRLEEHGLATRRRDREDRRVVHALLSAKGRAAAEQACGFRRQKVRELLEHFQPQELEALMVVLAAIGRVHQVRPSPQSRG